MTRQVCEIEFIVTDSEAEALTLEANLIKNHQPHFNVLLKDDKKYPYLCITWARPTRGSSSPAGGASASSGPFLRSLCRCWFAPTHVVSVKRVFPLRSNAPVRCAPIAPA